MDRICIIICYFGQFPETFQTFLKSCANNPSINWIIVTDINLKQIYECPENVAHLDMTLEEVQELAREKLELKLGIDSPYKLCDYKVAYGLIFEDYLSDYEWWGYGDCDVIYGDLRKFFDPQRLANYDKIYTYGHLCLLRNNDTCKRAFQLSAKNSYDWIEVYTNRETLGFDEHNGINLKMMENGLRVDTTIDFADRSTLVKRFRMVDFWDVTVYFFEPWVRDAYYPPNYAVQFFGLENGHTYQFYWKRGKLNRKEISYIHYRKKYNVIDKVSDRVYLTGDKWIADLNLEKLTKRDALLINTPEKAENFQRSKRYLRAKADRIPEIRHIINFLKYINKQIKRCLK